MRSVASLRTGKEMFQTQVVVLIAGLFALQMAVVCIVLRRSPSMERSGLTSWALGNLIVALATVLLAAHEYQPDWPLAGLPDAVLIAGLAAIVRGTRHFVGKRGRSGVLLGVTLVAATSGCQAAGAPPWLGLLPPLIHVGLLLELVRVTGPCLPALRGTGRLAALSLVLIALACAGINGYHAMLSLQALADAHPLAAPSSQDMPMVLYLFGVVGLSVSFALMAHDRLRRMLERRARHDDLTDVLLRGAFWEELEASCVRADRLRQPLTVAFVDLDHFKAINDLYGHSAGDSVLRHFAGLLRKSARPDDVIGRLGGEEFAIVMPNTTLENGRAASLKLNALVRTTPCPSEPDAIPYTVSIGMAERGAGEDADRLMRRADRALYDAKLMGRNCVSSNEAAPVTGMPRRPRVRERTPS